MLLSIRTKGLFNRYDYFFDFSKNSMTIIAGPNGFGKTTILNIIRDVLDDDLINLSKIPFEEIELKADNNCSLLFKRIEDQLFLNDEKIYVPSSYGFNQNRELVFSLNPKDLAEIKTKYNKDLSFQQTLNIGVLRGELDVGASTNDLLIRINAQITGNQTPKCMLDILNFYGRVGNSIYCGADRLYHEYGINDGTTREKNSLSNVIDTLSSKLNAIFNKYYSDYTQLSNELDFRFISRLNEEINKNAVYTQQDYKKDKDDTHTQISRLVKNGVIVKDVYYNKNLNFNDSYSLAFKVFYDNLKKKLSVLENITNKMELFEEVVNSKLSNKSMRIINPKNKLREISVEDGDIEIPLSSLSSGEKEIIIMYFKLIFEESNNLIALIDEPELSTHISWQYEALDDFEKIMSVNNSLKQIIVCTHSPQIINNRWESTIDLFDEANKKQ